MGVVAGFGLDDRDPECSVEMLVFYSRLELKNKVFYPSSIDVVESETVVFYV